MKFSVPALCHRRAKEWNDVDVAEKKRIELKKREDGEFWYVAHFDSTVSSKTGNNFLLYRADLVLQHPLLIRYLYFSLEY